MKWDFFDRPENKKFNRTAAARPLTLQLGNIGLAEALKERIASGGGTGTARSGTFEVQNDKGIYFQINDRRIELDTKGKAAKVRFFTWDEFEEFELKGIDLRSNPELGPRQGHLSARDLPKSKIIQESLSELFN